MSEQSFQNHTKWFPPFHFFVMPVLLIHFVWSIVRWVKAECSVGALESVVTAAALVGLALTARLMALRVQDRVIRLEERLRCERLLPADLKTRAGELGTGQLVALRFASDGELPELARRVLEEKMTDRKAIKKMVKNWRADYLRA